MNLHASWEAFSSMTRSLPGLTRSGSLRGCLLMARSLLLGAWMLFAFSANVRAAERLPNIVVILADDLGWADLGCYGSTFHRTPQLDQMAREGLRFTDAYAACTVCSPTRAALMTGKYPARLHLTDFIPGRDIKADQKLRRPDFQQQLPLEESTLAEKLKARGYKTASFGKWHLGGKGFGPGDQGFDVFSPDAAGFSRVAPFTQAGKRIEGFDASQDSEELTTILTRKALRFIEDNRNAPFFLYLPQVAVHIPLYGRPDLVREYQSRSKAHPGIQTNAVYAAMLESLDTSVGSILAKLRVLNMASNTLVVFVSDNGGLHVREGANTPATSNAPLRAGKGYQYEGGIRVPMIAWAPGRIAPGRDSREPVITMDLHSTFLEWAGIDATDTSLDGRSLASIFRGERAATPRSLFWHYPHYSNQGGKPAGVVREGNLKLIEHYESGYLELFDLASDLSETRNISGEQPDKANAMAKRLAEWRRSVSAQMPVPNTNYILVPLRSQSDGVFVLPAHEVIIHGVNVRYEPPAHKNTIGYWTRVEDWVSWDIAVDRAGAYTVEVLQGCGKGSGGSEVEVQAGEARTSFVVQDTGHFQNFVRREIGTVQLKEGRQTVSVHPRTKPGGAVMDLRELRLKPQ